MMISVFVLSLVSMGTGMYQAGQPDDAPAELWTSNGRDVMTQLPIVIFAFKCHQNIPIFYAELRRQKRCEVDSKFTMKRSKMMAAAVMSTLVAASLYAIAAVCGYVAFRQRT